jgi:hypothetical protein
VIGASLMKILLNLIGFLVFVSSAFAAEPKEHHATFGVTVKGENAILTTRAVQAVSAAADAYGIQRHHVVEAIDGLVLSRKFDQNALTEAEKAAYSKGNASQLQQTYILVTGVFGGGCVASPVWSIPATKTEKSTPIGVTNVRCAKTDDGFQRLLKVATVAMEI